MTDPGQRTPTTVVFGAGGHAREVLPVARACGLAQHASTWLALAPTDGADRTGSGLPCLAEDQALALLARAAGLAILAIGDSAARRRVVTRILAAAPATAFPTMVHPACQMLDPPTITVGPGTIAYHSASITASVRIGAHCILNSGVSLSHDVVVGDFVSLAPGAVLAGGAQVGDGSTVFCNAVVAPGVRVGPEVTVGAGSVVLADIDRPGVYVGSPARRIR